jgi:hypothetical protein
MNEQIKTTLYQGYLSLENGTESLPVLVARYFYSGNAQYRFQNKLGLSAPSIELGEGQKLYIPTETRNDKENPGQFQDLLVNFQNNEVGDPKDWAFTKVIDPNDKTQLSLLKAFAEQGVLGLLLCPEPAPNHPQAIDLQL